MISALSVLAVSLVLGPLSSPPLPASGGDQNRAAAYIDLFIPPVRNLPNVPMDGVKRSRTMRVSAKAIRSICKKDPAAIWLVLFPKLRVRLRTSLLAVAPTAKGRGTGWHAKIIGRRSGTAAMALLPGCRGTNASRRQLISGSVRLRGGRMFQVSPVRPGRVRVEQLSYIPKPGSDTDTPDPGELRP